MEIVKSSGRGWGLEQIYQRCDYADSKTECASALLRLVTYGLLVRNGSGHYYVAGHNVVEMQAAKTATPTATAKPLQPKVKPTKAEKKTSELGDSDELDSILLLFKDGRRVSLAGLPLRVTINTGRSE